MTNIERLMNKKIKVITMVMFKNGRKIKTDYIGILISEDPFAITIKELDLTEVRIQKKFIKRIEEI